MAAREPGDELLLWRRDRGLTQGEAAREAGLDQSAWSLLERGRRVPSIYQATALERVTGGVVKVADWLSKEQRRALARIDPPKVARPFQRRTGTDD